MKHELKEEQIKEISKKCHGYVGADLQSLCKEASLNALKRFDFILKNSENKNVSDVSIFVSFQDFIDAMKNVSPSALREISLEIPNVKWEDIGGQQEIKQRLKEAIGNFFFFFILIFFFILNFFFSFFF